MFPRQPAIFETSGNCDVRKTARGGIRRRLLIAACVALFDVGTPWPCDAATPPCPSLSAAQRDLSVERRPRSEPKIAVVAKTGDRGGDSVELTGLAPQALAELAEANLDADSWSRLFPVCVATDESTAQPAMLGRYRITDGRVLFEPRFPFQPGLKYRAAFDPTSLPAAVSTAGKTVTYSFTLPKPPPSPPAFVKHVYPSRKKLPENLLKFYIHFSAAMSRGEAYERIHLLDASGKRIEYPFLELAEELWNARGTRFTLLFDPGRIKQGLKPREDVGSPLEANKSYTLVVDREWSDAAGNGLKTTFQKPFKVVQRDDTQPDPKQWKFNIPSAGTTEPLEIFFNEPLDHAMLQRVLAVQDASGCAVPGRIEIGGQETRWRYYPQVAWQVGQYRLAVATTLEDFAGNSIGRPFEVDLRKPVPSQPAAETVKLPFTIRTPGDAKGRVKGEG